MEEIVLTVNGLSASFQLGAERLPAIEGVSFKLKKGKTLGIVGESGSGKSVCCQAILGLLPKPSGQIDQGELKFHEFDLAKIDKEKLRNIRGNRISMIFQEPMTALNPVKKVGEQLEECFQLHQKAMKKLERRQRSIDLLEKVGIPAPEQRVDDFPHQLSGGMRQRVMIAMALACEPEILVADEPTTALDVTTQAQIIDLLRELQDKNHMSIIFITHDMGVIAEICDEVLVMYSGCGVGISSGS